MLSMPVMLIIIGAMMFYSDTNITDVANNDDNKDNTATAITANNDTNDNAANTVVYSASNNYN